MKTQLCGCTNCMRVMIDENPNKQKELEFNNPFSMELFEDEEGYFWGCPHCQTDGYLIDIESKEHLNNFKGILK